MAHRDNGAVFKLTKNSNGSWTESVLYSFVGGTDGATPESDLTFDPAGNLYGTTWSGGLYSAGTVFKLVPNSDGPWLKTSFIVALAVVLGYRSMG